MLNSDLSLASIAADTGFSDGAHFGKTFKAVYGISPSEERRRIQQDKGPATGQEVGQKTGRAMGQEMRERAATANVGHDAIRVFDAGVQRS